MITRTRTSAIRGIGAALVAVSLLAACGGDDEGGSDTTTTADDTTTTTEATTTTVDAAAEEAAVGAVLTEFFSLVGQSDFDGAALLFENGEAHKAKLVHCADLVAGVTIEMTSVELTDAETATALFAILKDGEVLLAESGGGAVKVDGEWLVSENTFLSLYDAAKEGCTGTPPPE
ncbi:MAG: hypothetical protein ABL966_00725 [Acidimicrobiales bacterium]